MSLSSLIVQREIATIRQVEEALARQVLYGGDLVTNLLEIAKLDEGTLTLLLAESFGLHPAVVGQLPSPQERVRALVTEEMCSQRALMPLGIEDGALVVAVAEPLGKESEEELAYALGLRLVQRIAPMVRIREALARVYGAPLERRLQRLLGRIGNPGIPGLVPSQPSMRAKTPPPPRPRVNTLPFHPAIGATPAPSVRPPRATDIGFPTPGAPTPPPPVLRLDEHGALPDPIPPPPSRAASLPAPPPSSEPPRSFIQRDAASPPRPPRRRRGPITSEQAKRELDDAHDRDAILDLYFDYARQYFDYSALFVVHGDIAEGRDAYGDGASRDRVTGIGVPLDLDGVLAHAREARGPVQIVPAKEGLDPVLLGDLERTTAGEILVVPIVVRTRAVALFLGDSGDAGVEPASVREVVHFAQLVGQAFERVIVRRKLQGFISSGGVKAVAKVDARLVPPKPPSEPPRRPVREASMPPPAAAATPFVPRTTDPAPPPTAAAVHRPSGPPIPREEPLEDEALSELANEASIEVRVEHFDVPMDLEGNGAGPYASGPPSSEAVAIAPRRPPASSRAESVGNLPSVIVDVDEEFGSLVDRVLADPNDDAAEAELLRQGQHAMPAIMARFPGPTTTDRARIEEGAMRVAECGPVLRLIAGQRRAAVPFVLPLVGDGDPLRRYWATLLLTELAYPEAVEPLVPRLFDPEPAVRRVARLAARAVGDAAPEQLVDRLSRWFSDPSATAARRIEMVEAIGELRERLAVPVLLEALSDVDEEVAATARRALTIVTRQDFGREPRKWHVWWQANAARHRIEWLIDALMHEVPAMRRAAGEELKALTKEYFGYYDDLPKRERERAQQRYRDWWNTEGRLRFLRG